MEYYSALEKKKEGNPALCNNMGESKRYEPDTERHILHDLTYMWNLK